MNIETIKKHPYFGSYAAIAKVCGVSRAAVGKWAVIPVEHCPAIERATDGKFKCEKLAPHVLWQRDPATGQVTGYTVPLPVRAAA